MTENGIGIQHQLDGLDFTGLIDALHDEVVVLDSQGVIVATNEAWRRFSAENGGDTRQFYLGENYLDVCHAAFGASDSEAHVVPDGLVKTLRTGELFRCEYPCDGPSVKRWFEMTANRLTHNGRAFLVIQHRNVTTRHVEQEDAAQALVDSSAMAALVAATSDAILSYDMDGKIVIWNRAAEKLYGYTPEEAIGQSLEILYPPDWPRRVTYYRDEILAGRLSSFEATRIAKDGTPREVWVSCDPIRSARGDVVAISNIHRDVTEVRRAEKSREMIAREVIHRAKNMLGIVNAIQRQTARVEETLEGFHQSFSARIQSLAKSTDLLVNAGWTTVSLKDLVEGHLEPFTDRGDATVTVSGPAVDLMPQGVQTIGMAIHELATNSTKYGVLHRQTGKIDISWTVGEGEDGAVLRLAWRETGSGRDGEPGRKGYGSVVLTSLAPSMLDAETEYRIAPDGVSWTLDIAAQHFSI